MKKEEREKKERGREGGRKEGGREGRDTEDSPRVKCSNHLRSFQWLILLKYMQF